MQKFMFATACLIFLPLIARAEEGAGSTPPPAYEHAAPDNTKINKRDRDDATLTPLDQSNQKSDLRISQAIRKSLIKNRLSVNAKNIKIITINGEVTLRGPVNNNAEKKKIAKLTTAVAGVKSLNNELEVK